MSIRFPCPGCDCPRTVPEHAADQDTPCPGCGQRLEVPQPPAARALPGWRFLSPSSLLFCLVLFPLPWVELRCNTPRSSQVFATQSGFQSIYGGFTRRIHGVEERRIEDGEEAESDLSGKPRKLGLFDRCAPHMALFVLAVLGGVLAGFLLRWQRARQAAVGMLAALAILLLSLQVGIGFPLERIGLEKPIWRVALKQGGWPKEDTGGGTNIELMYTPWLILTYVLLAVALGAVAAEWYTTGGWAAVRSRLRRNRLPSPGAALEAVEGETPA